MLAKLSGSPISTQISSVTAPATSSGTSVISTSVIRRSASQSNRLITSSAQMPAWMNALHDGVAGFEDRHRPADRIRLGRQHGIGKLAQIVVVVGIALRQRLDADQAVLGLPAIDQFRRQRFQA